MNKIYETDDLIFVPFFNINLKNSNYYAWMHDQEVTRYNSHGLFPYTKKEEDEWRQAIIDNKIIAWAIVKKIGPKELAGHPVKRTEMIHIGNVSLQSFNWINRSAEIAIVIGEKQYWGKGYATKAFDIMISHGFMKLNLHRIWSGTASINNGMIRVFEKVGMQYEGTFRDGTFLNGRYVDVVCYAAIQV